MDGYASVGLRREPVPPPARAPKWTQTGALQTAHGAVSVWRSPGPGRPLVAVHGLEDGWHTWKRLARRLSGRFQIYALDMPWRVGNDYRWSEGGDVATWLTRGLSLLPGDAEVLVAHSFGANSVLRWLSRRPQGDRSDWRPGAVALIAPFFRPAGVPVTADLRRRALAGFTAIVDAGLLVKLGARRAALDDDILDAMAVKLRERVVPVGFPIFYDEFVGSGELPLGEVATPTLVLAGTADESLSPTRAAALAERMPASDVRIRAHYSHFSHLEQVDEVADELGTFLDDVLLTR